MAVKYFLTKPKYIAGQWRAAGDEIDITGYRQGALAQLMEAGDVAAGTEPVNAPVTGVGGGGESFNTVDASGATLDIDLALGNVHDVTLDSNCTLTFSNPAEGLAANFTLIVHQDATGTRLITWPASVIWAGGTAPTLSTDASATDVLTFFTVDDGVTWYGFIAGQALA